MKKRILLVISVIFTIALFCTINANAAETIDSGTCGNDVVWTLNSDGLLTISGNGDIENFSSPGGSHRDTIISVIIENGVTGIGDMAFWYCENLTSISIPDSVTYIGDIAFNGCENLVNVTLGSGITSIPESLFDGCRNLTNINIPDSVTHIGAHAFERCENLTSISIPDSVTYIGDMAFMGCYNLTEVHITNLSSWLMIDFQVDSHPFSSIEPLKGGNLYLNGSLLTDVIIPDGITEIADYAFLKCSSIQCVYFDHYNSESNITRIGNAAFSGCRGLVWIDIPITVREIGNFAFSNCGGLNVVFPPEYYPPLEYDKYGLKTIGDYAFANCDIRIRNMPDTIEHIGFDAFYGTNYYEVMNPEFPGLGDNFENYAVATYDNNALYIDNYLITTGDSVSSKYTINPGTLTIADNAFFDCPALTSITIPSSVKNIGAQAFYGCSNLTRIYYYGTENEWNAISIGNANETLTNITPIYLGIDATTENEFCGIHYTVLTEGASEGILIVAVYDAFERLIGVSIEEKEFSDDHFSDYCHINISGIPYYCKVMLRDKNNIMKNIGKAYKKML